MLYTHICDGDQGFDRRNQHLMRHYFDCFTTFSNSTCTYSFALFALLLVSKSFAHLNVQIAKNCNLVLCLKFLQWQAKIGIAITHIILEMLCQNYWHSEMTFILLVISDKCYLPNLKLNGMNIKHCYKWLANYQHVYTHSRALYQ